MTTARLAAARALLAVESGRTTLPSALDRERRHLTDDRDRALAVELAAGVLRWRAALDAEIAPRSRRPIAELSPEVLTALRLAAYQLRYLDRVPVHALVNESVELIRVLGQARAAGFVNAVLRSLTGGTRATKLPVEPGSDADRAAQLRYLTTTLSHPEWLVARWLDRYGYKATEAWCQFNNRSPDVTAVVRDPAARDAVIARANAAIGGGEVGPAAWVTDAIRLPPGSLGRIGADVAGEVSVQDEGAQIVAHAVGVRAGERVLDLCASPGGKAAVLGRALQASGLLVACDHRHARIRILREALERTGTRADIVQLDARGPLPFLDAFDRVLLDAPCSGLGTLRRDPDLKWSRTVEDVRRFAGEQATMLERAAAAVRPGGCVVYATCSSEPEENDDVVEAFLARRPDFGRRPADLGPAVPGGAALVDARGDLRTLPFRDSLDAYFAAMLVRRS